MRTKREHWMDTALEKKTRMTFTRHKSSCGRHRPEAATLLRCRQALNVLRKFQCFLNCVYRFMWRCPTPTAVPVAVELRPDCAESACPRLLMVSISPHSYLPPFHFLGKSAQISWLFLQPVSLISKEISNLLALFSTGFLNFPSIEL